MLNCQEGTEVVFLKQCSRLHITECLSAMGHAWSLVVNYAESDQTPTMGVAESTGHRGRTDRQ